MLSGLTRLLAPYCRLYALRFLQPSSQLQQPAMHPQSGTLSHSPCGLLWHSRQQQQQRAFSRFSRLSAAEQEAVKDVLSRKRKWGNASKMTELRAELERRYVVAAGMHAWRFHSNSCLCPSLGISQYRHLMYLPCKIPGDEGSLTPLLMPMNELSAFPETLRTVSRRH